MKFRVSSKDLAMLVFMAVLLFLGAGLITSNLSTLLNEGVFTVNPFIGWVNHTGLTVIVLETKILPPPDRTVVVLSK